MTEPDSHFSSVSCLSTSPTIYRDKEQAGSGGEWNVLFVTTLSLSSYLADALESLQVIL